MNTNRASASHRVTPIGADDFTLIRGIGPRVKSRLHGARILTFAQLAALSPKEILATIGKMPGMSVERIIRENWVGQARERVATVALPNPSDEKAPQNSQRYATFKLELLIDETGGLRRTHIAHVQSTENASWAGWEQARLIDFIVSHAGLNTQCAEEIRAAFIARSVPLVRAPANTVATLTDEQRTSTRRLREFVTIPKGSIIPRMIIARDETFSIRLSLDLSDLVTPAQKWLNYEATVRAKNLDGGAREIVGQSRGTILSADTITINIESKPMLAGTYRLEAIVALAPPSTELPSPLMLSGGVLQVY